MHDQSFIDDNVTVVIRTIGERTERLCYELLKKQVPEENMYMVCESPFTEALKKTFNIAIEANRKWTFVVDADVLIHPRALSELVEHAETEEDTIFGIEGKVIDKFLDSQREAGNHFYRTKLMQNALQYVPNHLDEIRPESFVKMKMRENGYAWQVEEIIVGLHDFEQSYRDIYRKSFVQAKKHYSRVHKMIPPWDYLARLDTDYVIALKGFEDGKNYPERVGVDQNSDFLTRFDGILLDLNVREKDHINDLIEIDILWTVACYFSHILRFNKKEHERKDKRMKVLEKQIEGLLNSNSFKLGWAVLGPVRFLKNLMQK